MDQPENKDENEMPNMSQDDTSAQSGTTDNATPINVTVQSDDDAVATEPVDSVMEGVPTAGAEPMTSEVPNVESAEEAVDEALPQSTDAELAAVASELEHMAVSDTPMDTTTQPESPEPEPETDKFDPMNQIMEDAEAESMPPANAESFPSSMSTEETASSDEAPDVMPSQEEQNTETESQPIGSMETENEYGTETPDVDVSDMPEPEVASQPAADNTAEQANPEAEESVEMPAENPEVSVEDTPSEPELGGSTEPESTPEMAVSEAPSYSEPLNDQSSSLPAEEAPAAHSETNDVVTPSIVAAAVAAGTAGDNAITGTPETSTTSEAQEAPKHGGATAKKSGKGMIIMVVVLVTLLFGGGAVAAYMMQPEASDDTATSESTEESESTDKESVVIDDTATPGEKVEAKTLDDYKAACSSGGMVTNADSYSGDSPHPVVVFEKGSDDKYAQSLVNFKDTSWAASSAAEVTSGQLVVCVARKTGSEVKLKDCPITDSVTKVTADVAFYSTKYTVDVYQAQTGKKVSSFENSSLSTACPTSVAYDKNNPKIYAGFDQVALETSLEKLVTATL